MRQIVITMIEMTTVPYDWKCNLKYTIKIFVFLSDGLHFEVHWEI